MTRPAGSHHLSSRPKSKPFYSTLAPPSQSVLSPPLPVLYIPASTHRALPPTPVKTRTNLIAISGTGRAQWDPENQDTSGGDKSLLGDQSSTETQTVNGNGEQENARRSDTNRDEDWGR